LLHTLAKTARAGGVPRARATFASVTTIAMYGASGGEWVFSSLAVAESHRAAADGAVPWPTDFLS
jgi:hypothetical protein